MYLDDILIYSRTVEDHIKHMELVLKLHAQVGIKLNLNKCHISSYVDKIRDWPLPSTGKELVSFLGFCSYYRGFIPEFSKTTAGLNKLRNEKNLKFKPPKILRK